MTICAKDRECLFGDVINQEMVFNNYGVTIQGSWQWLADQYDYVEVGEFIIMPNHLHGIIWITHGRRGGSTAPTNRKPLGRLIGAFKTVSTKRINQVRRTPGRPVWQRNYFERVVRNEPELNRIHEYILEPTQQNGQMIKKTQKDQGSEMIGKTISM